MDVDGCVERRETATCVQNEVKFEEALLLRFRSDICVSIFWFASLSRVLVEFIDLIEFIDLSISLSIRARFDWLDMTICDIR